MTVPADRPALEAFDRGTILRVALGFLVALVVLGLLAVGVGTDRLLAVLARTDPAWVALGCLSTLVCLTLWARAWQVVLGVVGVGVPFRRLVVTFYAATFANYVTPLGQAGGEPFIAYVLSRDTEASYEDSLAAVVTADLLNLLPFFTFAGVGFAALLWNAGLPGEIRPLAAGIGLLAVAVPVLAVAGWRYRLHLGRWILRALAPVARITGWIDLAAVRERLQDLNASFERIAADPSTLVRALGYSYAGWVFFTLPLLAAGNAVGVDVGLLLVLFIVPASTLAGLVPSPGGLGGVEAALLVLLVAVAGLAQAPALAIAFLYRIESYWFALVLGGAAALLVIGRN